MNRVEAFKFVAGCLESGDSRGFGKERIAREIASDRMRWESVVEIASESWMTLALYRALDENGWSELLPAELLEYFVSIHDSNAARNRGILEHTAELAGLLNQIGVEPLLLKGAGHLASGLYPDPAMRFMSDIDILVPDDRALECWHLLLSAGYRTSSANAQVSVERMPNQEWPALWREGRTGELEIHHRCEWDHMLSTRSLYTETEPLTLGGGTARILSPTSRVIFTIAHAYVHHRTEFLPVVPLRDLYDATLLLGQLGERIDWQQVVDVFDRAGQSSALRIGCTMWRRLLAPNLAAPVTRPAWAWIYWRLCLLNILSPRWTRAHQQLRSYAHMLRLARARTADGKRLRREMLTPALLLPKLIKAVRLCTGALEEEKPR